MIYNYSLDETIHVSIQDPNVYVKLEFSISTRIPWIEGGDLHK